MLIMLKLLFVFVIYLILKMPFEDELSWNSEKYQISKAESPFESAFKESW